MSGKMSDKHSECAVMLLEAQVEEGGARVRVVSDKEIATWDSDDEEEREDNFQDDNFQDRLGELGTTCGTTSVLIWALSSVWNRTSGLGVNMSGIGAVQASPQGLPYNPV
jgi:hypothetical protein